MDDVWINISPPLRFRRHLVKFLLILFLSWQSRVRVQSSAGKLSLISTPDLLTVL